MKNFTVAAIKTNSTTLLDVLKGAEVAHVYIDGNTMTIVGPANNEGYRDTYRGGRILQNKYKFPRSRVITTQHNEDTRTTVLEFESVWRALAAK